MDRLNKAQKWLREHLPDSPWIRVPLGVLLVLCGLVGFLPVLGFWMVPVGLAVLAIDFPPARKLARWLTVKIGRKFKKKPTYRKKHA